MKYLSNVLFNEAIPVSITINNTLEQIKDPIVDNKKDAMLEKLCNELYKNGIDIDEFKDIYNTGERVDFWSEVKYTKLLALRFSENDFIKIVQCIALVVSGVDDNKKVEAIKEFNEECIDEVKETYKRLNMTNTELLKYMFSGETVDSMGVFNEDSSFSTNMTREQELDIIEKIKTGEIEFKDVDEQTEDICVAAIEFLGCNLAYVKEQTERLCFLAINTHDNTLKYVRNQTEEMCLEAVGFDPYDLRYVHNQTIRICLAAVSVDGEAVQFVRNQTDDICLEAVKNDWGALQYVINQTKEICLAAARKNRNALMYVRDIDMRSEIENILK